MTFPKIVWKNALYLLTVSLPVLLFDQVTKVWALSLKNGKKVVVFKSWWNFIYVENKGALWGLGSNLPDSLRKFVFLGIASCVTLFVIYLLLAFAENRLMKVVYALILAGACGNLYDRFFGKFKVVDFIDWHLGEIYHWPTFNIADVAIVVAVVLLVLEFLFFRSKKKSKAVKTK